MAFNFMNNVRQRFGNVAQDVSAQAHRFREDLEHNNGGGPAAAAAAAANLFGFGAAAPAPQQPGFTQRAPPASARAIRQLPTIRVAPEDLIDPNNRECCVCLEENRLDDRVTRLPCAHIFHSSCVVDWLVNHSCTCPVCRYELPTDDPQYEAGRMERMKSRKPRFAIHELRRLPVSELLALHRRPVAGGMEKKDLIQMLIDTECVDIIPSPEPVEYRLDTLKRMKIRELKHCMEDAGVYFRPEDVVEKDDMITIFQNSGRLILTPTPETASTPTPVNSAPTSSTTTSASNPVSPSSSLDSAVSDDVTSLRRSTMTGYPGHRPTVETVTEDSEDEDDEQMTSNTHAPRAQVLFSQQRADFNIPRHQDSAASTSDAPSNNGTSRQSRSSDTAAAPATATASKAAGVTNQNGTTDTPMDKAVDEDFLMPDATETPTPSSPVESLGSTNRPIDVDADSPLLGVARRQPQEQWDPRDTFRHYTISNLQDLAEDAGIDISFCFERREMVDLMVRAGVFGTEDPTDLNPALFRSWRVSHLRFIASEANIDLSTCHARHEMVEKILETANTERPYLKDYFRSLSPLTRKTLAELRSIARELRVDISDCLEKDEIVGRLISRRTLPSVG